MIDLSEVKISSDLLDKLAAAAEAAMRPMLDRYPDAWKMSVSLYDKETGMLLSKLSTNRRERP